MKPQDLILLLIIAFLIWKRNPKYFVVAGLMCILASAPLFHFWVFFTAQRLIWYSLLLLLIAVVWFIFKNEK